MSCGACSPQVHDDAFAVRRAVFMEEQGYENEFEPIDEDPSCIHVVLYVGEELAGCARVFPEELERTLNPGMPQSRLIKLHAQEYIRDLYAAEGYEQISEVDYEDEGQPHLWMAKRL